MILDKLDARPVSNLMQIICFFWLAYIELNIVLLTSVRKLFEIYILSVVI